MLSNIIHKSKANIPIYINNTNTIPIPRPKVQPKRQPIPEISQPIPEISQPIPRPKVQPIPEISQPIPEISQPIPEISQPIPEISQENKVENKIIYIISNIQGGGSKKYLDDITNHYTNIPIIYIKCREILLTTVFLPTDILFVQHLLFTNIFPEDINVVTQRYNIKTIISIHDFYWIIPNVPNIDNLLHIIPPIPYYENIYLNPPSSIHPSIMTLFNNASIVIHPSSFTKKHFDTLFRTDNTIVQYHNDIKIDYTVKQIPKIINNQINIGNFQPFSKYKGSEFIPLLQNKYTTYNNYKINFLILGINIPLYDEMSWYNDMKKHHFHCLLHLNKYGETYSYSLTKSINSGLPILYNNIGAYKERIPENEHYKKVYNSEYEMNNYDILYTQFEKMLDYIIDNQGKFDTYNPTTTIEYKDIYNYIFDDTITDSINSILHNKIKPFAIYFPQFHVIPENNKKYVGMTDIVNLKHYIKQYKKTDEIIDTPSLVDLSLSDMLDYKLTNKEIIKKQIKIAKSFSIYGFACYYYWFSENSITNNNTIFENCYNLFFQEVTDFKIYFICANEDWPNNSCNDIPDKIINVYNYDNYMKNINNLMKYFKHSNYYKLDNKPVFFIHQANYISPEKLSMFSYMLEKECVKNGFDGLNLYLNNININPKYNMYNWSPTFNGCGSIDYHTYTNTIVKSQIKNKNIQTIFFDFNNSSKFCIPYKPTNATKYTNTSIYNQNYLIDTILTTYKQNKINKILLINSWNNWGENTSIEPGQINKKKYLSLLKSNLLSFIP